MFFGAKPTSCDKEFFMVKGLLIIQGICETCGKEYEKKAENQKYCSRKCANRMRARRFHDRHPNRQKQYLNSIKNKVFKLLGNKCVICGEADPIVLSVDHIIPVGNKRKLTYSLYFEIVKNSINAKEKYQLLCRNCNWRKRILNNE